MMETVSASPVSSRRKSCVTCIVAKSRCMSRAGSDTCERCIRLRKQCVFDKPAPESRKRKANRVDKLEERVESLVALLTNQATSGAPSSRETHLPTPSTTATSPSSVSVGSHNTPVSRPSVQNKTLIATPDEDLIPAAETEFYLARYRREKVPSFPFVVVPLISPATFRAQNPFLFLTMAISFHENDVELQKRLEDKINNLIAQRIVLNAEKTLELVQGLLVYLAWYHFHTQFTTQLTLLRSMVFSMVGDLSLDRPPGKDQLLAIKRGLTCQDDAERLESFLGTPDAKRAYLGCYYIATNGSVFRRTASVMKHTKWTDECCRSLLLAKEHDTDTTIETIIRAQTVFLDVLQIPETLASSGDALIEMMANGYLQQLADIESSLPSPPNETLALTLKATRAFVYEIALFAHDQQPPLLVPHLHNKHLWSLLSACRSVVEHFLNFTPHQIQRISVHAYTIIWYSLLMFTKALMLPALPATGWDPQLVWTQSRGQEMLAAVLAKIAELREMGTGQEKRTFESWNQLMSKLAAFWRVLQASPGNTSVAQVLTASHEINERMMALSQIPEQEQQQQREVEQPALQQVPQVQMQDVGMMENWDWTTSWHWNELDWMQFLNEFSLFPETNMVAS